MNKTIKKEFLPGGERRQELLDQVPEYLSTWTTRQQAFVLYSSTQVN